MAGVSVADVFERLTAGVFRDRAPHDRALRDRALLEFARRLDELHVYSGGEPGDWVSVEWPSALDFAAVAVFVLDLPCSGDNCAAIVDGHWCVSCQRVLCAVCDPEGERGEGAYWCGDCIDLVGAETCDECNDPVLEDGHRALPPRPRCASGAHKFCPYHYRLCVESFPGACSRCEIMEDD